LAVAPVPMAMSETTAPTPMMMPSMVSAERSLLAARARKAIRKFSGKFMGSLSGRLGSGAGWLGGRRRSVRGLAATRRSRLGEGLLAGPRRAGRERMLDDLVADDVAVGNAHHAGRVAGDKGVMGDVEHGLAQLGMQA